MRKIKFRGKRVDNGEWVYGYVYCGDKFGCSTDITNAVEVVIINNDYDEWQIGKETVGQFTELYDKNGTEIYEGDIVVGYGTWNLIVSIEKGHTVIKWTDYDSSKQCVYLEREWINGEEAVVIGNIHDNPELLK